MYAGRLTDVFREELPKEQDCKSDVEYPEFLLDLTLLSMKRFQERVGREQSRIPVLPSAFE
jgi:hypothetical protein